MTHAAACTSDDECSVHFLPLCWHFLLTGSGVWVFLSQECCLFLVGIRGFAAAVVCQSRSSLRLQHFFEFQRNGGIVTIFSLQVLTLLLIDTLHGYQRILFILKFNR